MLGWFVIGGVFFWLLVAIEVISLTGLLSYRRYGEAIADVVVFAAICFVCGNGSIPDAIYWLRDHGWFVAKVAAVWLVVGVFCSFFQFRLIKKDNVKALQKIRAAWLQANGVTDVKIIDGDAPMGDAHKRAWTLYVKGDPNAEYGLSLRTFNDSNATFYRKNGDAVANRLASPLRRRDEVPMLAWCIAFPPAFILEYVFTRFLADLVLGLIDRLGWVYDRIDSHYQAKVDAEFLTGDKPVAVDEV